MATRARFLYTIAMDINKYPIGKLEATPEITPEKRKELIEEIAGLPARLRKSVKGASKAELDAPIRDGGWTLRQIVHHIADAELNGFTRFKFALTQDNPALPAYDQDSWAAMADAAKEDIAPSLSIMDGVSARISALLSSLSPRDFQRTYRHTERGTITIDFYLQLMAWHGKHHTAQIEVARKNRKTDA
jgi:uncharacterized damage-inducible protein DinB